MRCVAEGDDRFPVSPSLQPRSPEATSRELIESLSGLRVLAVDDDPFSLELIAAILRPLGVEVRMCADAAGALRCMADVMPDVLVADIAMPDEDGISLITRLRERDARQGGHIPAVAVSGYAREQDRRRAFEAGFQSYLIKPIEPEDLVETIASLARDDGAPTGH